MESALALNFGANRETAMLVGSMVLLLIVEFGGEIIKAALRLAHRARSRNDHSISAKPTSVQRACADRSDRNLNGVLRRG